MNWYEDNAPVVQDSDVLNDLIVFNRHFCYQCKGNQATVLIGSLNNRTVAVGEARCPDCQAFCRLTEPVNCFDHNCRIIFVDKVKWAWSQKIEQERKMVEDAAKIELVTESTFFNMETTLHDAITTWGEKAQFLKSIEEFAELCAVISKFVNCDSNLRPRVVDEIADSYIMLTQLRELFGREEIDAKIIEKTKKLAERIKEVRA